MLASLLLGKRLAAEFMRAGFRSMTPVAVAAASRQAALGVLTREEMREKRTSMGG